MGWKKMIIGEEMPDKDDPRYKQRYEKEVDAGRKFARTVGIDKLAAKVQYFAINQKKTFLALFLALLALLSGLMIYRIATVINKEQTNQTATERQEEAVRNRRQRYEKIINSMHSIPPDYIESSKDNNNSNKKDNGHTEED